MKVEELQAYELVEKRGIAELNSTGYYLKHKKKRALRSACFPTKTATRYFTSAFGRLLRTIRAFLTLWSIPYSADQKSFR